MSQNALAPDQPPSSKRAAKYRSPISLVRSASGMRYRVSVYRNLDECAVAWRLLEGVAHATAFQHHAWVKAWLETVGHVREVEPRIALVRDEAGDLMMILPMAIERVLGVSTLVWMAQDEADYHGPLIHPKWDTGTTREEIGRILSAVAASVPEAHAFALTKTLSSIEGVANPLRAIEHTPHPSSGHAITLTGDDFDTFYAGVRSKSTRKRDRQRRRRLQETGTVEFKVGSSQDEQHTLLDAILDQKALWLSERGISNPFAPGEVKAFLHHLISDQTARGALHISALTVDGQVAAGNVGYVRNERFYAVIGSVTDGELSRHSPGTIHLHELLRWCYAHHITAFDLTVGDESYKKDWCDARQELIDIRIPLTAMGYLSTLPCRIKDTLKRHIKASPFLYDLATSLRQAMRSVLSA
ncbi:MAG: GNAT family N-acetyltransferase [Candidatus Phaeomarinobacter sp.]